MARRDFIKNSRTYYGVSQRRFSEIVMEKRGHGKPSTEQRDDIAVEAEILQGRWIVQCPFCPGAEMADEDDKWFLCLSCYNEEINGAFIKVVWPSNARQIETVLMERKRIDDRTWTRDKSIMHLEAENVAADMKRVIRRGGAN